MTMGYIAEEKPNKDRRSFAERWICVEPGCGKEACGHMTKGGKHFYFCDSHWDIYVGIRSGVLESLRKESVCESISV